MASPARHLLRTARLRLPILVRNALLPAPETEPLSSHSADLLRWYTCGPTVYDDAHIGHARAYVTLDVYRRMLARQTGTPIHYSLGVTDVDDKIVARARERGEAAAEVAALFERRFFDDLAALNVQAPSSVLRVSEHVADIVDMTERLVRSDKAYAAPSGSVYFSVAARGARYTQLDRSRGNAAADVGHVPEADVAAHRAEKRAPADFALWKAVASDDPSTPSWPSPWGAGRPGWHVECAAMAMATLGPRLDVHAGGIDLRFPHHTNELAAAEASLDLPCSPLCGRAAVDDERWTQTWLHVGHLHMAGRKMSKSLKNFVTVREFLDDEGADASDVFRLFCLATRFDAPAEFTHHRRDEARATLAGLSACARAQTLPPVSAARRENMRDESRARATLQHAADAVETALAANLDGPGVLRALRAAAAAGAGAPPLARAAACEFVRDALATLGFSAQVTGGARAASDGRDAADKAVDIAVQLRARARGAARQKDAAQVLQACDDARAALSESGVRVQDAKDGTSTWTRA